MAVFFETMPGFAVRVLPSETTGMDGTQPMQVAFDEWKNGGSFEVFSSIVTGVAEDREGNVQFSHTLGNFVYVYAFGDRIGQMQVSGVCFPGRCDKLDDKPSGLDKLHAYYDKKKVAKNPDPIGIQLGTTSDGWFVGFLTGMRAEIANPEFQIAQFTLRIHTLPRK